MSREQLTDAKRAEALAAVNEYIQLTALSEPLDPLGTKRVVDNFYAATPTLRKALTRPQIDWEGLNESMTSVADCIKDYEDEPIQDLWHDLYQRIDDIKKLMEGE